MDAGTIIGERYVLDRQIGEGGMAAVWLAQDQTLRRLVAVKFLWSRDQRGQTEVARAFLREARLAASVHHPNVVQVLDFGLHEAERPYMVMEALDGESLGEQFNAGKVYTLEQVAHVGLGTLEGLIAVHEAGIAHRDLKPENIFLVAHHDRLQPKLLDFGISRVIDEASGLRSAVASVDGHIIGTPEYMAPEQARGLRDVDHRVDLYAMAVILYEMVAGDVPYKDEAQGDLLMKIVAGGARSLHEVASSVPKAFSDVIATAMACDRALRYQSAVEMYDALKAASRPHMSGEPVTLDLPKRIDRRRRVMPVAPPDVEEDAALAGRERTGRVELDTGGEVSPAVSSGAFEAQAQAQTVQLPQVSEPRSTRRLVVGALAVALLGGIGVMALLPGGQPEQPRYIVVQAAGGPAAADTEAEAEAEAAPAGAESNVAPADTAVAPPVAEVQAPPAPGVAPRAPKAAPQMSRADRLAAAFKRQKGPVVACFRQHPDLALDSISVRVSVDVVGHVSGAEVLPAAAATSGAGRCVVSAVGRMRFGKQPSAVSFRVPLRVTRQ